MKMELVNELITKGYSVLFIMDQLINDFVTTATMQEFYKQTITKFPDPTDTTQTYSQEEAPCTSLLISKQPPTTKPAPTTRKRSTHLTLVSAR